MGEFVYRDWSELSLIEGEGGMGGGEKEAGPKTQGEEGEAGRKGGLRGLIGPDGATQQLMRKRGPPAPSMSNLEVGVEGFSLAPSRFTVPVVTAPRH